jgi:hypothetical protein
MSMPTSVRYESKRDAAFAVLVGSVVLVSGGAAVLAGLEDPTAFLFAGILTVLEALFLAWIWYGTFYEFDEDLLVCHSGPFKERIRLERILSVRSTTNMLSSMALSRDRLEIRYGAKSYQVTLVSPVDRAGFLDDFRLRCPNAVVQVDEVPSS